MTKKVRVICHSKRLNALYPMVPRLSFFVEYELNYKSIYSCDFATLTRYNSRQTRFSKKFLHISILLVERNRLTPFLGSLGGGINCSLTAFCYSGGSESKSGVEEQSGKERRVLLANGMGKTNGMVQFC